MTKISILLILFIFFSATVFARGPAVEDFVGIEVEGPEKDPQGTEALFNFEKDMRDFKETPIETQAVVNTTPEKMLITNAITPSESYPMNSSTLMGIVFILSLPMVSWAMVMTHMRRKAGAASANNIAILDQYRKNRKQTKSDDIKKAS